MADALATLQIMLSPIALWEESGCFETLTDAWRPRLAEGLTRATWAELCRDCFETLGVAVQEDDYVEYPVRDCTLADVKYVLGYGLVRTYPGFNNFTPDQRSACINWGSWRDNLPRRRLRCTYAMTATPKSFRCNSCPASWRSLRPIAWTRPAGAIRYSGYSIKETIRSMPGRRTRANSAR